MVVVVVAVEELLVVMLVSVTVVDIPSQLLIVYRGPMYRALYIEPYI